MATKTTKTKIILTISNKNGIFKIDCYKARRKITAFFENIWTIDDAYDVYGDIMLIEQWPQTY
jgi:hypothetical protein